MIIVPTDTPGFELVRNIKIMGDAGSALGQPRRDQTTATCASRPATCSAARAPAS